MVFLLLIFLFKIFISIIILFYDYIYHLCFVFCLLIYLLTYLIYLIVIYFIYLDILYLIFLIYLFPMSFYYRMFLFSNWFNSFFSFGTLFGLTFIYMPISIHGSQVYLPCLFIQVLLLLIYISYDHRYFLWVVTFPRLHVLIEFYLYSIYGES